MSYFIKRYVFLILAFVCLFFGILGILLPLLPTTPFVLLAAFLFSKSSPAIHKKFLNNKIAGPIIKDWEQKGVINKRTKWIATITMLVLVSYPLIFKIEEVIIQTTIVLVVVSVLTFIWSRPSN